MRKLLSLFVLSTCFIFVAKAQQEVATVNFTVSKIIGSGNLGGGAAFIKDVMSLADDPNFDLQPVLDNFYDAYMNELSGEFPFSMTSQEEVTSNPDYAAYVTNLDRFDSLINLSLTPEGYKLLQRPILGANQRDKDAMLQIFSSKDGVIFVYITFEFNLFTVMGVGTAKINAIFNMICYNKEGKKVFSINQTGTSSKGVTAVGGIPIMKLEKIQPMCESAAADLLDEIRGKLPKIIRKSAKKL